MLMQAATRSLIRARCSSRIPRHLIARQRPTRDQHRTLFSFLRGKKQEAPKQQPVLSQDDLFHVFSKSPFPALKQRGEAIKKIAPCPVCVSSEAQELPSQPTVKKVAFECPDCGWPTHCSEEHWHADEEHQRYCGRLREVNEDEHDLRSGRKMTEFEMPGPIAFEETVSFANWDIFWYTRGFPSMDTERMRRHASKLLTYPMTIANVLHQHSGLTLGNQRVTPEGIRALAALRSTLHVSPGTPENEEAGVGKPVFRIFVIGARGESSLPPHVWEQLSLLFPAVSLHVHFIGPQVSLPKAEDIEKMKRAQMSESPPTSTSASNTKADPPRSENTQTAESSAAPNTETQTNSSTSTLTSADAQKSYLPNVYQPPTPAPIPAYSRTRSSVQLYGAPAYTHAYAPQLSITGIQAPYETIHPALADSLDPYADVFFVFHPGFGFPSQNGLVDESTGQPLPQAADPAEWGSTLPMLLQSKCSVFVTGFSPADVERDVRALASVEGVAGEFDWVITPGENPFGSERWEVADFDPRVMIKTNWGIWGIKGKRRDIREYEKAS